MPTERIITLISVHLLTVYFLAEDTAPEMPQAGPVTLGHL